MTSRRLVPFSPSDWSFGSRATDAWPARMWPALDYGDPWPSSWTHRSSHLSPLSSLNRLTRHLSVDGTDTVAASNDAFEINLDVTGYDSSELQINLVNRCLTITGNHESKSSDGNVTVKKQFTRSYQLPENVDVDKMKSLLTTDSHTLRIEAPLQVKVEEKKKSDEPKEIPLPINRNALVSNESEKK